MSSARLILLTGLAMLAFAGNSLLCRLALRDTAIDPTSFTLVRLLSGAVMLGLLVTWRNTASQSQPLSGSWRAAGSLFVYAAGFSFAYVALSAATGALILFAAVQLTMIGVGYRRGERLNSPQLIGLMLALSGLIYMLLPGLNAPAPKAAVLMIMAGVAWGIYSLQAKSSDPLATTYGNFLRSLVFAILLGAVFYSPLLAQMLHPGTGLLYALASGAVTSGLGYAIWYKVLPYWSATQAACIQLSAPLLAAIIAIPLLGEALNWRLLVAGFAILGGIALVIAQKSRHK